MKGRQLLQYIIDTSDVVLAKRQEATEYLEKLENVAKEKKAEFPPHVHKYENSIYCSICGEVLS